MRICQNPHCSNPFNREGNKFCTNCGSSQFGILLRNRYRVLSLLGEGGFSKTYAAEDVDRLNAPCVIKQFFPQVEGTGARLKAAKLFKEEAVHLYELGEKHLQIPKLLAYFQQGLSLCLVQEFIQGKTLLQELLTQSFNEAEIIETLTDLCSVLEFVHAHNVIHRDIKPENIIRRQSDRKLVLIDFGGAKQLTQTSLARQATAIYTIGYAPSEQMAGFACQASDLYALGVTCVRMITKTLPEQDGYGQIHDRLYDAMNAEWLWRKILSEKGIKISEGLGNILDKLLKHLPKDRYQSAVEILKDLQDLEKTSYTALPQPVLEPEILSEPKSEITPEIELIPETEIEKPLSTPSGLQIFTYDMVRVDSNGNETSRDHRSAKFFSEELGKDMIVNMVLIPGGTFTMGSPITEGDADERPQHQVSIKTFFLSKFPITQTQWRAVAALPPVKQNLDPNPSKFRGANRPVENISWYDAREFCARLQQKTGRNYRLPSEAEWEYACRAGTNTPFHFGETITSKLVNCNTKYEKLRRHRSETTTVGNFQIANAFGLYDMHGLVWEWCADPWHKDYQGAPDNGGVWEIGGDSHRRVLRGGSWNFTPDMCRSASRSWNESDGGLRISGVRVAMNFWDWINCC